MFQSEKLNTKMDHTLSELDVSGLYELQKKRLRGRNDFQTRLLSADEG